MTITPHQHQMGTDTGQGLARFGACRLALVADHQFQFAGAPDAPQQRPVSRILLPWDIGHHFPVERIRAARGAFIPSRYRACKPFARNSLTAQQFSQCIADRFDHIRLRLSSSPSSAGFKTSWKDLTFGTEPLSPGGKIHD